MTMTTNTGGVRMEGRRCRGRPCRCDGEDGDAVDQGNSGEVDGVAGAARRCSGEIRATSWPGRGRGRRSGAGRGGGDVGRCTGNATVAAGGGTVAATPLFCRRGRVSGAFPAKRRADRGRGGSCEAEGEDGAAGRRTGAIAEAAGGGRRSEREREEAGRGAAAAGELEKGLKQ